MRVHIQPPLFSRATQCVCGLICVTLSIYPPLWGVQQSQANIAAGSHVRAPGPAKLHHPPPPATLSTALRAKNINVIQFCCCFTRSDVGTNKTYSFSCELYIEQTKIIRSTYRKILTYHLKRVTGHWRCPNCSGCKCNCPSPPCRRSV